MQKVTQHTSLRFNAMMLLTLLSGVSVADTDTQKTPKNATIDLTIIEETNAQSCANSEEILVRIDVLEQFSFDDASRNMDGVKRLEHAISLVNIEMASLNLEIGFCEPEDAAENSCEMGNLMTGAKYIVTPNSVSTISKSSMFSAVENETKITATRPLYWKGHSTVQMKTTSDSESSNPKVEINTINTQWNRDSEHEYMLSMNSNGTSLEFNEYENCSGNVKLKSKEWDIQGDWKVLNGVIKGNYAYCTSVDNKCQKGSF